LVLGLLHTPLATPQTQAHQLQGNARHPHQLQALDRRTIRPTHFDTHEQHRSISRAEQALYAGVAMEPLREITLLAALDEITFSAHWVPPGDNLLADLLSRRQFAKIAEIYPLLSSTQPEKHPPTQTTTTTPVHFSSVTFALYPHRFSRLSTGRPPSRPPQGLVCRCRPPSHHRPLSLVGSQRKHTTHLRNCPQQLKNIPSLLWPGLTFPCDCRVIMQLDGLPGQPRTHNPPQ
jgi:hypothetical protein